MLPSMPILFTRESQDAFGNKIEPSTSFFSQNYVPKPVINPEPPPGRPAEPNVIISEANIKKETDNKKSDPPIVDNKAVENAFIRSYYTRVQQRFSSNPMVPTNKFLHFQTILRDFNPNKESPIDLYKKIEQLFGPDHKDMVEDFLLFLKPGQAAQIGRFMDRFSLVQMTTFIDLLHKTFARKPTVLRKVVRAITTGLNSGSSAETKTRVLPHFRAHPRLTAMFKALFPDERPPDSLYESGYEVLTESFLTNDTGCEEWEHPEDPDAGKRKLHASDHLDTVYLNGRVFLQHGRLLRPARVTFPFSKEPYRVHARRLASAQTHLSPPESDDDTHKKKPPPKRPRKQAKSPTKKDVNDNTRKDKDIIMSPKPKKPPKPKNGKKDDVIQPTIKKERNTKATTIKKEPIETTIHKQELKLKQSKVEAVDNKTKDIIALESPKLKHPKVEVFENIKPKLEVIKVKQTRIDPHIEHNVKAENTRTNIETTVSVDAKKLEINSWTRDEDKTMLQVLKGEASSEKVFGRIRELLPHRSESEIKDRFCHVMTLLQQMAVGEVT